MAEEVLDFIEEQLKQVLSKDIKGNAKRLREAAITFLDTERETRQLLDNRRALENEKNRLKRLIKKNTDSTQAVDLEAKLLANRDSMVNIMIGQDAFQRFESAVFKFQKEMNDFLGQVIILTFIDEEGRIMVIKEESGSLVTLSGADAAYATSVIKQAAQQLVLNFEGVEGLKVVYDEILRRADHSRQLLSTANIASLVLIMWKKKNGRWWVAKVPSMGIIHEAYADFYLNQYPGFAGVTTAGHSQVEKFVLGDTFYHTENGKIVIGGIAGVDSDSGMLKGDISTRNGLVQYGIKAEGASALGYVQVVKAAEAIRDKNVEEITEEFIRDLNRQGGFEATIMPKSKMTQLSVRVKDRAAKRLLNQLQRASS